MRLRFENREAQLHFGAGPECPASLGCRQRGLRPSNPATLRISEQRWQSAACGFRLPSASVTYGTEATQDTNSCSQRHAPI